jgi:hypothetical protein
VVLKLEDWFHIFEDSYHGLPVPDTMYQTTWCHNPDDHNSYCEILKIKMVHRHFTYFLIYNWPLLYYFGDKIKLISRPAGPVKAALRKLAFLI